MAGTRKKDKPVKRKPLKKPEKIVVSELDGWKVGDVVWGMAANKEVVNGTIVTLHDTDQIVNGKSLGYAVTIVTVPDSKYRVALTSSLTETKPKGARVKRAKKK